MENRYLHILELHPGATKAEIKAAYRRLSKKYHPDVSKDANAKERFIEVNEAYKFLTQVGPSPHRERVAYNYDPGVREFEQRRKQAREYARARARDAERRQSEMIKNLLFWFDRIAVGIFVFNLALCVDFLLPLAKADETILFEKAVYARSRSTSYSYDDVYFNNYRMRFAGGEFEFDDENRAAAIYTTRLLDRPMAVDATFQNKIVTYNQLYNVYRFFGFLIPLCLVMLAVYRFAAASLDLQLTLALFLLFISSFQVYLFFKF